MNVDAIQQRTDVAALLGVTGDSVCYWENNRTSPALRLIPRLTEFLHYAPWTPSNSLPERLKIRRRSLGLSQEKLAKLLGVDESSLAHWEKGSRQPAKKSLEKLEAFLEASENCQDTL